MDSEIVETYLNNNMEKFKLDNTIIILPLLDNNNVIDILNNASKYKIIHIKKNNNSLNSENLIAKISSDNYNDDNYNDIDEDEDEDGPEDEDDKTRIFNDEDNVDKTISSKNLIKQKLSINIIDNKKELETTKNNIIEYIKLLKNIINMIKYNNKKSCLFENICGENTNILSSLNHQLRTPLQGITSSASILQSKSENTTHKKILKHLLNSCLDLNMYINDIMDFYLLKEEKMIINNTDIKLNDILDSINGYFESDIKKKNINYQYQISIMIHKTINTDKKRLKQILRYILSNSINFSENESIKLEVTKEEDKIIFTVIDTGSGIKEGEHEKVWNAFYQIEQHWITSRDGLGLGLTNAKMICCKLGGDIKFIDSPYDRGTAIEFYIKDRSYLNDSDDNIKNLNQISFSNKDNKNNIKQIVNNKSNTIKNKIDTINKKLGDNKKIKNILIVEDNVMNAELIKLMIESKYKDKYSDYTIHIINDSRKVIEHLKINNLNYDIIYLDLKMPYISGFDILKKIKEDHKLSIQYTNKIILITALPQNKDIIMLTNNSIVNSILYKPIQIEDL